MQTDQLTTVHESRLTFLYIFSSHLTASLQKQIKKGKDKNDGRRWKI